MNRREFVFSSALGWLPFSHRSSSIELAGMRFHVRRRNSSGRRYLHIHGNEPTARDVLNRIMDTHSGVAYLIDNDDRYVMIEGTKIDPNRLFSRVGAEKNLYTVNPGIAAVRVLNTLNFLDRHREDLIQHLQPSHGDLLLALHNNREYSVQDEVAQSDDTSIKEPNHPTEFFLCTDPRDFAKLRTSPYNVVLQNQKPAVDDGSLSHLAAKRGFRYVNLECRVGNFDAQMERVRWVEDNL